MKKIIYVLWLGSWLLSFGQAQARPPHKEAPPTQFFTLGLQGGPSYHQLSRVFTSRQRGIPTEVTVEMGSVVWLHAGVYAEYTLSKFSATTASVLYGRRGAYDQKGQVQPDDRAYIKQEFVAIPILIRVYRDQAGKGFFGSLGLQPEVELSSSTYRIRPNERLERQRNHLVVGPNNVSLTPRKLTVSVSMELGYVLDFGLRLGIQASLGLTRFFADDRVKFSDHGFQLYAGYDLLSL